MTYAKSLKYGQTIFGVAAVGLIATAAWASTGSGVTGATPLVTANLPGPIEGNHDRVKFQTKDPTVVRVQSLTFAANSRSGWHHHPGIVIVAVQSGLVTLTDANCGSITYGPTSLNGSVFVERSDEANEASSVAGAVVYATYIVPNVTPLRFRLEDDARSC